jgi:hypothetical protein
MKGCKTPTAKRSAKCPQCGLYFAPAGLCGHIRFYHKKGIAKDKQKSAHDEIDDLIDSKIESKRIDLMLLWNQSSKTEGSPVPKLVVDGALQLLAFEYIHKRGIFKEKH